MNEVTFDERDQVSRARSVPPGRESCPSGDMDLVVRDVPARMDLDSRVSWNERAAAHPDLLPDLTVPWFQAMRRDSVE